MRRPEIRVKVAVKPELAVRRPPRQLIELLDKPEDEFRLYVERVEGSDDFRRLVETGAVRRVRSRGRVPREKYEEYMDVQLMQFLRQYRITERDDWERDFLDREALVRVPALAHKYSAPEPKLRRMIDYYQRVTSDRYGTDSWTSLGTESDGEGPDYVELIPSRGDVDVTDNIVLVREFVETYGLTQADLVNDFLNGDRPATELAARHRAPLQEVEEILDALGRMRIVETLMDASARAPAGPAAPPGGSRGRQQARPVAKVFLTDNSRSVAIQFTDDSVYSQRYRTSPDAVRRVADISDREAAERLLLELQWINQRKTLLCRLVMAVCNFQYRYFLTGALIALKPLSQADMARDLGEDEATVCRLLRDKFLDTPYGLIELKFLFQKKTDVIRRIVRQHPELTDNEIREILATDYGTEISRRTVAYHRLKFQRGEH